MVQTVLVYMWLALSAYAVFGGADFGAGIWDLFAGGPRSGAAVRARIEHSIGPVWEANHVWLIFLLVVMWTGFPRAFSSVVSTMYIPFSAAAFGIIARGSGFAFRKEAHALRDQRLFGATFALASLLTPLAFGAIAGGVASGRVPAGIAMGSVVTSWLNPTSVLGAILSVLVCAYISAVLLCGDAQRHGETDLAEYFRRRALITAVLVGATGAVGTPLLRADAPALFNGLLGRGLPLMLATGFFGLASLALLWRRAYLLVRPSSALAVTCVVWAWAAAQYPYLLYPTLSVSDGAAAQPVLAALVVSLSVGIAIVVPCLVLLFVLFQRAEPQA